jgi:glycerol-3-phosphate dehydrogenase (NAD(P)+)
MNVTVIGSGSWGCAFARLLSRRGHDVQVLTLTGDEAEQLNREHANPHYLPEIELPVEIRFAAIGEAYLEGCELLAYVVPTQSIRQVARWAADKRPPSALQLSLAKGLELSTLKRPSEIIAEETGAAVAALSGPNHAEEIALDMPSATVVACVDETVARTLQAALIGDLFRVYTSTDIVGVEFCGAAKNPIALAVGMSDGLGYGDNTRATLITRSLAELARVGARLGGNTATFVGLAGIGDVIATCTSRHSRNRLAGELLAKGESPAQVEARVGQVVEGIPTAYALHDMAAAFGIDLPVTENVYQVLAEGKSPADCVRSLMGREPTHEVSGG